MSRVAEVRALREQRDRAKQLLDSYDSVREDIAGNSGSVPAVLDAQRKRLGAEVNGYRNQIRAIRAKCSHVWEAHIGECTRAPFWKCTRCDDITEIQP